MTRLPPLPDFQSKDEIGLFYQANPLRYINDFIQTIGKEPGNLYLWPKQTEIINSVKKNKKTIVVSANGIGKTFIAAKVAAWFLMTHSPSIVLTTAPTWAQVERLLWGEIRTTFKSSKRKLTSATINKTSIAIKDKWYAVGLSTNQEERFQGTHEGHVLVIVDEASGVDRTIFKSISGIINSAGAKLLAIGNPNKLDSRFYELTNLPGYNVINVPATEHPNYKAGKRIRKKYSQEAWDALDDNDKERVMAPANIIPGALSYLGCEEIAADYGRDSAVYRVRVLGMFPEDDEEGLIPYSSIMNHIATEEDMLNAAGPLEASLDVARLGKDKSVLTYKRGKTVLKQIEWSKKDAYELSNLVRQEVTHKEGLIRLTIDCGGVGGPVYDILKHDKDLKDANVRLIAFDGANSPKDKKHFTNCRAETYWELRKLFENPKRETILIPNDQKLIAQLSSIKWETQRQSGKIQLENKDKMNKSPDNADSLMMLFKKSNNINAKGIFVGRNLLSYMD